MEDSPEPVLLNQGAGVNGFATVWILAVPCLPLPRVPPRAQHNAWQIVTSLGHSWGNGGSVSHLTVACRAALAGLPGVWAGKEGSTYKVTFCAV